MKTKKLASLSTLAGGILLILALFRGTTAQLLLIAYLCLWTIVWVIGWVQDPNEVRPTQPHRTSFLCRFGKPDNAEETESSNSESDPYDGLLLQHVEARITELLCLAYPKAEWQWCEKDPETIILEGGAAWIRTRNTGTYRDATLSFEEPGDLHLEFVETAPLHDLLSHAQAAEQPVAQAEPAALTVTAEVPAPAPVIMEPAEPRQEDVSLWYSLIGQKALTDLITELNIHQCSQISIAPNGDVFFTEPGGESQRARTLEQMPSPKHWPELKQLLEQQELKVSIQDDCLSVAW